MIETLFANRANATNIYTIVTINAIIFQHAILESIDNIVDAFHGVATILLTAGLMQTDADHIWFLRLHCINLARIWYDQQGTIKMHCD